MTKRDVYIARRDPGDELGEKFIVVKVRCETKDLTGSVAETDHLIRAEILSYISLSPNNLENVIANVITRMNTNYGITDIPDRDIISQINEFIDNGNLVRTELGDLVIGERYFEDYVGVFETASGVLSLTQVKTVTYTRVGTTLTVTLDEHGLNIGDLVAIENPSVVNFTLTDFDIKSKTTNTFTLLVSSSGKTAGSDLALRIPSSDVIEVNEYTYNVSTDTYQSEVMPSFTLNLGLISKNDIAPPRDGRYKVFPSQSSRLYEPDTNQDTAIVNGLYLLNTFGGGSLKTGIYRVSGNNGTLDDVVDEENKDITSHILRNGEKIGGGLQLTPAGEQESSGVPVYDPTSRTLRVTFTDPHGISGEEYMFTSIDRYTRLKVVSETDNIVNIHLEKDIDNVPTEVSLYRTVSKQIPQTIERYVPGEKVRFETLREIRNPNWDPSQKIDLPPPLDQDALDGSIVQPPNPTVPTNFNKYKLNDLDYPEQEYQLADLQCEVFGSVTRALDGLRLSVDTSKVAREGVYREYHSNGHLKMRSEFKRVRTLGIMDGLYEEFFENGETRVSYVIVPYHPYETQVGVFVIGTRILVELANHNVLVGDTIVLNDSIYVVEDCPNPDQMYITPQALRRTDTGYVTDELIREKGYFRDDLVRLFDFERNGNTLVVNYNQHGLKPGDEIEITNINEVGFGQTSSTVISTPNANTITLSVENKGSSNGRNLRLKSPNVIRRVESINGDMVTASTVIISDVARATFGNSVIHGSYIEYHKTLAFRVRCTFDKGVLQGELVQWDEEGNREYVAEFDRGNLKNREVLNYTFTY